MRAVVRGRYGPPEVLRVEDVARPVPAADEVLVRIRAASINLGDWELLTGRPRYISVLAHLFSRRQHYQFAPTSVAAGRQGWFAPKARILGTDFAGRVESVGGGVTRYAPGDEIFGMAERFGALAEYVCVPESAPVARKPPALSFEQAAALPQAALIAMQGIGDKAAVRTGQSVLVNGAGGGAGTLAVQLAKLRGAEVTGVDGPTKQDMLRSIGADRVIDYTREDFVDNGERYDLIFDLVATRRLSEVRGSLTDGGIYLVAGGSGTVMWQTLLFGSLLSRFGTGRVQYLLALSRSGDLEAMAEMVATGRVTAVIDRHYALDDSAAALQRVGDKLGIGKVLIVP